MADKRTSLITIGLSEIQVGVASKAGVMPAELHKIGKTYKDTCKIAQDAAEVTEHYEEGMAAPEVRKKSRKIPTLTFSIMDANVQDLVDYVGGENIGSELEPKWGYDGNEVLRTKQSMSRPNRVWTSRFQTAILKRLSTGICQQREFSL